MLDKNVDGVSVYVHNYLRGRKGIFAVVLKTKMSQGKGG